MKKALATVSKCLLVIGAISALCETDWRISVTLLAAGFGGLISYGLAQGTEDNDRYRAAVMENSQVTSRTQIPVTSPYLGLLFLLGFLSAAFISIYLNSPWPIGSAFIATVAIGVPWALRRTGRQNVNWQQFASHYDFTFVKGDPWDSHNNAKITGKHDGRNIRFELVWQDSGSSHSGRRRSAVLIAEVATTIANVTFCIDQLKIPDSAPEMAKRLFETRDLAERIEAAAPKRIGLFEEFLTFHFPRVPLTEIELKFCMALLTDTAETLERF